MKGGVPTVLDDGRRGEGVGRLGDVGVAVPGPQVEAVAEVGGRDGQEGRGVEGRWGEVAAGGGHDGCWVCRCGLHLASSKREISGLKSEV